MSQSGAEGSLLTTNVVSNLQPSTVLTEAQNDVVSGNTNKHIIPLSVDVDARDSEENTTLIVAAAKNDVDSVSSLLAQGANPNSQNIHGYTPLLSALASGFIEVAYILLKLNKINVQISNLEGATALHYASILGDEHLVREVIQCGAYLNAQDMAMDTVLHWVIREQREHMLTFLLKQGCKPNLANEDGETALHLAAVCGEVGMVETLLRFGASTTVRDNSGSTPLDEAISNEHYRVAQLLARRPSSSYNQSLSPSSKRTCGEIYDRKMNKNTKNESMTQSFLTQAGASF